MNTLDKNLANKLDSILEIDNSIRFIALLLSDGTVLSSLLRPGIVPLLDNKESKKALMHEVLRSASYKTLDAKLGKATWSVINREKIKWINLYMKDARSLTISTEVSSDHDKIIKKALELCS